jgi:hypothetical protein
MPPKKLQNKDISKKSIDTFLVTDTKQPTDKKSQKKSQTSNSSLSKSKSRKIDFDENGLPIIKLVLQENLLKSLNKIYERQNHELLKIISIEKTIPLNDLMNFMDDQSSIFIKEIDSYS